MRVAWFWSFAFFFFFSTSFHIRFILIILGKIKGPCCGLGFSVLHANKKKKQDLSTFDEKHSRNYSIILFP